MRPASTLSEPLGDSVGSDIAHCYWSSGHKEFRRGPCPPLLFGPVLLPFSLEEQSESFREILGVCFSRGSLRRGPVVCHVLKRTKPNRRPTVSQGKALSRYRLDVAEIDFVPRP